MQKADIVNQMKQIIASEAGIDQTRIHEQSRLYHDFGIAGDDIGDILQRVVDRWATDFSQFKGEQYSPTEQKMNNPFEWIAALFTDVKSQYPPLTVDRLAEAILVGKWSEE